MGHLQFASARAWLYGHGIHAEPTWFVALRLAGQGHARYQHFAGRHPLVSVLFASMPALPSALATVGARLPGAWYYLALPLCLFPFAVSAWFNHEQVVGERRIAATLPRRVARPVAPKWTDFLDGWLVCALVLTYLGGFGMAAGLLALGEVTAGGLLAGVVLLGGCLSVWQTRRVLNRPALAEDALSLLVDDRLRAAEVRRAATPLAAYAFLVPAGSTELGALQFTLFGLMVATVVCWLLSGRTPKRRVAAP